MAATLGIATLETAVDTSGLDKGLKQSKGFAQSAVDDIGKGFKMAFGIDLAGAVVSAAGAVKQFAADSLDEFQTFEKGVTEVFTLLPNASAEANEKMKADVLSFSTEVGRTTDEVVPALYQAISAGVPPDNVFNFLETANAAALGGVTDLETAVDGISSAVNAYGSDVLSAAEASDLMFTAVKGGKTDFESLANTLFNVIPTAAALGVEFGNITAALAAMTAQGTPTSVATTQLRQLLVELSKEGSKVAATFEQIAGQSFKEFVAGGGNLQQALQILEQHAASAGLGINDLFGSVEAGSAALSLTGQGTAKFTAELEAAENAMGATATAADTMAGSMGHLQDRVAAAAEAYKIGLGEGLSDGNRILLEAQLKFYQTAAATSALRKAAQEGTITWREYNHIQDQVIFTTQTATEAWAEVEAQQAKTSTSTDVLRKGLEMTNAEMGAWEARAAMATTSTEDFSQSQTYLSYDLDNTADSLAYAALVGADLATENERLEVSAADVAAAEEARAEAHEAAAKATEEAERAAAALESRLGGYFDAALTAEGQTKTLEQTMYDMGLSAGLGASDMAILAAATGDFTQEQIEAAFQAALMTENIGSLVEAIKAGTISVEGATSALQFLKTGEADTAAEAMNLAEQAEIVEMRLNGVSGAAGTADSDLAGVGASASAAANDLNEVANAANQVAIQLNGIPTDIHITITTSIAGVDFDNPDVQNAINSAMGGGMQHGGWTGFGQHDRVADFVHHEELVVPANVLRGGMDEIMSFARRNVPSGVLGGGGGGMTINIDARGATNPGEVEAAARRGAEAALHEAGVNAYVQSRTR